MFIYFLNICCWLWLRIIVDKMLGDILFVFIHMNSYMLLWVYIWSVNIWICMSYRLITCLDVAWHGGISCYNFMFDYNWLRTTYVHWILMLFGWERLKDVMTFDLVSPLVNHDLFIVIGLNIYLMYWKCVWASNVHNCLTNCMSKPMCKPTFNVYCACSVEFTFSAT